MKKTLYNKFNKCQNLKKYDNIILIKSIYINQKLKSLLCIIQSQKILSKNEINEIKFNIQNCYLLKSVFLKISYYLNSNLNNKILLTYFNKKIALKYKNLSIYLLNNCYIFNNVIYINIIEQIIKKIEIYLKKILIFIQSELNIENEVIFIYNYIKFKYDNKINNLIILNNYVTKKNNDKIIINIKCKIFRITKKILNHNKNKTLYEIHIFDNNNHFKIITFVGNNIFLKNLCIMKKYYVIEYYILYNIFNIYQISKIISIKLNDPNDYYNQHRIELHAHSNMSAMDGVSSIENLLKKCKDIGQSAIAITDHGVVQSFPEAMQVAKNLDMKVIFGTEGYMFDNYTGKNNNIVINTKQYLFEMKFTIVDIVHCNNKDNTFEVNLYKNLNENLNFENYTIIINNKSEKLKENVNKIKEIINNSVIISINAEEHANFLYEICNQHFTIINLIEFANFFINKKTTYNLSNIYKLFFNDNEIKNNYQNYSIIKIYKIFNYCLNITKKRFRINNINDINLMLINKDNFKNYTFYHIIIIAKNQVGMKNLYRLISESHINYFYKKPRIPKSLLEKYREGLIIGSACEAGEVYSSIINNVDNANIKKIINFYDYLEIQPLINNKFLIDNKKINNINDLIYFNKKIFNIGKSLGKVIVATGDVHYANQDEHLYRNILMYGMGYSNIPEKPYLYLKSTNEMIKEFIYLGTKNAIDVVIKNTNYIASLCDNNLSPIPNKLYTPILPKNLLSLEILVNKKFIHLYGNSNLIINERLEKEMSTILKHNFDVMYIVSHELIKKSNKNGYLVGSRGSVGSSFVAYLLSITEVNPLPAHYICSKCKEVHFMPEYDIGIDLPNKLCKNCGIYFNKAGYNIPFEVFLGFDGEKAPDIDLNFSGEYQLKAHKHVAKLFGKENIFRAGTISTIAKRTAYGFVKKYVDEHNYSISKIDEEKLIQGCTGIKRTTGQHPGGIMILPNNISIYDICPIQYPADSADTNIITTHFDYNAIHNNLLKLDLLGHDDPTMLKYLQDITNVNVLDIPLDDKKTMSLFISTNELGFQNDKIIGPIGTIAIPEFGTKFVREMLKDTKPQTFSELIKISGLSHGTDVWLSNAQDLIKKNKILLKDVICVRDDIMNYLMSKNIDKKIAFDIMEDVRKGKGLNSKFELIMKEHGIPEWYINSCKKIKYIFPKAHASAYVIMAFRIAWFKLYYPLEFYSIYFSIRAKNFDATTMTNGINNIIEKIQNIDFKSKLSTLEKDTFITWEVCYEFYKRGFTFKDVDIYLSDLNKFIIYKNKFLIPPLTSIIGLGQTAALNIIEERNKKKFSCKEDFIKRCPKISKNIIKIFEEMNILNKLPNSLQISLF